jgi:oligopeptide transport system substrate-binding protein
MASVDVLPIDNPSTAVNLFLTGGSDLMMDKGLIPNALADELRKKPYFHHKPFLATWFIRFNAKRKPYDDPRVRKALTLVLDRDRIVNAVTRLGEVPAFTITPPGTGDNYQPPAGLHPDITEAKRLLAAAGFPDGRGFPVLSFLYPSKFPSDRGIAVELQSMWQRHLGITVALTSEEYKTYLDSQKKVDYDVCRSSWVGDYNDPNTFLDMFLTTSGNNRTGWSSAAYDALIALAAAEADATKRYAILKQAETQLIETECVIAPVYHYVGVQFYQPEFLGGVEANLIDEHPLRCMFWKQPPPRLGGRKP